MAASIIVRIHPLPDRGTVGKNTCLVDVDDDCSCTALNSEISCDPVDATVKRTLAGGFGALTPDHTSVKGRTTFEMLLKAQWEACRSSWCLAVDSALKSVVDHRCTSPAYPRRPVE